MNNNEYLKLRQKLEEHCNKCMIDGYNMCLNVIKDFKEELEKNNLKESASGINALVLKLEEIKKDIFKEYL